MGELSLSAFFIAGAVVLSVLVYENAHKPMPTDIVAQRISCLDRNDTHYSEMVKDIIEHAKKDTVYRDTCGSKK